MNIIDIILLVPLIIGAVTGFRKGFIMEVVSLLALILAIIGAFHFLHWGMQILTENFQISGKFLPFLAFILIFVGIVIIVNTLGKMLKKIVDMVLLGGVDKIAGGLLGALKYVFLFSVLIWIFQVFGFELPEHMRTDSYLYPYVVGLAPATIELFGLVIPASSDLLDKIADLLNFSTP